MRAFVFTDPALASEAGRFVWLALDVEKKKNAAARKAYPAAALPTFLLVHPGDGSVLARRVGGMSLDQLKGFLRSGEAAYAATKGGVTHENEAAAALARAEKAYGAADYKGAADAYVVALATPPAERGADERAVEAALFSLSMEDRPAEGLAVAEAARSRFGKSPAGASVTTQALDFALSLPDTTPGRKETIAVLEQETRARASDPSLVIADDDRSGMLSVLVSAREVAGDSLGAHRAAVDWLTFLEGAKARAKTTEQRTVYDGALVSASIAARDPARALPLLEASAKEQPGDYNPLVRMAALYNAMKRWDEGEAAAAKALELAYGPRKLRVYATLTDARVGKGDTAAARRTLDEAIAYAKSLPEGQVSASTIASLEKRRDGLGK